MEGLGAASGGGSDGDGASTGQSFFAPGTTKGVLWGSKFHELDTGSFTLSITEVTADHPGQEQVGIVGGLVETDGRDYDGRVPAAGDEVLYRFNAEEGTTYQLDTEAGTLLDTVMQLKDMDGTTVIMENDDDERAAGRTDSYIEWECPRSGEYYVMVRGFGFETHQMGAGDGEGGLQMYITKIIPCGRHSPRERFPIYV